MVSNEKRVTGCLVTQTMVTAFPAIIGNEGGDEQATEGLRRPLVAESQSLPAECCLIEDGKTGFSQMDSTPAAQSGTAAELSEAGSRQQLSNDELPALRESIISKQHAADRQPEAMSSASTASQGCRESVLHPEKRQRNEEVLMGIDAACPRQAVCGVKGIWVSSAARRVGVASQLLDSARLAITPLVAMQITLTLGTPYLLATELPHKQLCQVWTLPHQCISQWMLRLQASQHQGVLPH